MIIENFQFQVWVFSGIGISRIFALILLHRHHFDYTILEANIPVDQRSPSMISN